jgi:16S rRNA (guanine527-N7)-methyltransferase
LKPCDFIAQAAAMGLTLSPSAVSKLKVLMSLLAKWNSVYNLTARSDEKVWVSHHLLDSLSIVPILPVGRLVDVGSGAGFPGLPIAVADPDREIVLLDSNQKKSAFLRHAVAEMRLDNVSVETVRVEAYKPPRAFDIVVSRAFSSLADFVRLAGHLCSNGGRLLAMKVVLHDEELDQVRSGCIDKVIPLSVPTLEAQRHAVFLDPYISMVDP